MTDRKEVFKHGFTTVVIHQCRTCVTVRYRNTATGVVTLRRDAVDSFDDNAKMYNWTKELSND